MYQEPILERYGTFREVTQGGGADVTDPFTMDVPDDSCDRVGSGVNCPVADPPPV